MYGDGIRNPLSCTADIHKERIEGSRVYIRKPKEENARRVKMNLAKRPGNSEALTQLKLYLDHPVGEEFAVSDTPRNFLLMFSVSRR